MNTPAHILIGWAAFARRDSRPVALAAILGALAPDLSLYLLASTSLFLLNIPPSVVFDQLYFSPLWQGIFAVDNSFLIWGAALAIVGYSKSRLGIVFCSAALLHIALDFPLHHDDGRAHFWPLSDWIFESPVSYWDHRHHAGIVGPIEAALSAVAVFLIARGQRLSLRHALAGVLLAMELFFTWRWFNFLFA